MNSLVEKFLESVSSQPWLKLEATPVAYLEKNETKKDAEDIWRSAARKRGWMFIKVECTSLKEEGDYLRAEGHLTCEISPKKWRDPENIQRSIKQIEEEAMRSHFTNPIVAPAED